MLIPWGFLTRFLPLQNSWTDKFHSPRQCLFLGVCPVLVCHMRVTSLPSAKTACT